MLTYARVKTTTGGLGIKWDHSPREYNSLKRQK